MIMGNYWPMVDHGSPVAPYLQVAALLRDEIQGGQRPPGSRMPSIIDLTQMYGIARGTAHKTLKLLADEGLIEVGVGMGYFVRRQEPPSARGDGS